MYISAEDVYLAQRGVRTLATRLKAHGSSALEIAEWLDGQDKIVEILHPAFASNPGHEFWKRDFLGATGVFTFILNRHLNDTELSKFFNEMRLFRLGYSWGGYESLAINFDPTKIRTATSWQAEGTAIRLSIGLENVEDLKKDLADALARI